MGAYSPEQIAAAAEIASRDMARLDLHYYSKYMFKKRRKYKWQDNHHHKAICDALMKVFRGETRNLIINLPPRYSKTELGVINFITFGLGHYPDSEFIHLSYSGRLATASSYQAKGVVTSPEYKELFPDVMLASDSKAKDEWRTTAGGVVYAAGADGTITGYGAGKVREGFGGAIIIDDPHKANEAASDIIRQGVCDNVNNTILSRRNQPDRTPIIVIMQRLHEMDMSGFLLGGGTSEHWEHLCLPAIYTGDDGEDRALWPEKHSLEKLREMEKADPYNFAGQYMQRPAPLGGGIWKTAWWRYYRLAAMPRFRRIVQSWDTAFKTKDMNDYSVCTTWGEADNAFYLIDIYMAKLEAPDLRRMMISLAAKHRPHALLIEDKASGQSMIQELQRETRLPVIAFNPGTKDKVQRAQLVTPLAESGRVYLPEDHPETAGLVLRQSQFPNGAHDDDNDSIVQALMYMTRGADAKRVTIGGI